MSRSWWKGACIVWLVNDQLKKLTKHIQNTSFSTGEKWLRIDGTPDKIINLSKDSASLKHALDEGDFTLRKITRNERVLLFLSSFFIFLLAFHSFPRRFNLRFCWPWWTWIIPTFKWPPPQLLFSTPSGLPFALQGGRAGGPYPPPLDLFFFAKHQNSCNDKMAGYNSKLCIWNLLVLKYFSAYSGCGLRRYFVFSESKVKPPPPNHQPILDLLWLGTSCSQDGYLNFVVN